MDIVVSNLAESAATGEGVRLSGMRTHGRGPLKRRANVLNTALALEQSQRKWFHINFHGPDLCMQNEDTQETAAESMLLPSHRTQLRRSGMQPGELNISKATGGLGEPQCPGSATPLSTTNPSIPDSEIPTAWRHHGISPGQHSALSVVIVCHCVPGWM